MGLTITTSSLSGKKWLFAPTTRDEQIVEQERERLADEWPGLKVTRTDAIRSLFARGTATEPGETYAEEKELDEVA